MAQHDYSVADGSGATVRADINDALSAIATSNSGATAPSTTFGGMVWFDTANDLFKIRNEDNDDWVTVASFSGDIWRPYMNGSIVEEHIIIACSDETTAISAGSAKVTFRMPYAFTLTAIPRASLTTAQATSGAGGIFTVDINEGGTSILSTKLTIDNTEKTSTTAAAPAVLSDTALADDAEITIDVDQIGDGTAKGLKVTLIGYRT